MKIAIIGTAPHRAQAPFQEEGWEIWACSPGNMNLPRWDYWFEVHDLRWFLNNEGTEGYMEWLRGKAGPQVVMMNPGQAEWAAPCQAFPRAEVLAEWCPDLMTSSIAWMLAWAIMKKPEEIGIWGVDMAQPSEYGGQRPALKTLMWEARKRGIKLVLPAASDLLLPSKCYGDYLSPVGEKMERQQQDLLARIAEAEAKRAEADRSVAALRGALGQVVYVRDTFG